MKKLFSVLLMLTLLLCAGCAKRDDTLARPDSVVEKPVDSSVPDEVENINIPEIEEKENEVPKVDEATEDAKGVQTEESDKITEGAAEQTEETATPESEITPEKRTIEQMIAEDHPELDEYLTDKKYIIVQAKSIGESVKVLDDPDAPSQFEIANRMKMEITKVYRAPYAVGDIIAYWELLGTFQDGDDLFLTGTAPNLSPVEENIEYLMVIEVNEETKYGTFYHFLFKNPYCGYSHIPVNQREAIAKRNQDGTATQYDEFYHALFEGLVE